MLSNLIMPEEDWNIETIARVIPDIHDKWPENYLNIYPRIIKSHFPYQKAYYRVIYIYRDGRDVAISYYDYLNKVRDYQKTFDEYFQEYIKGRLRFGAWHVHLESWFRRKNEIDILPIRYADMVQNIVGQMQRVGEFLGFDWNITAISSANQKSSLEKQRKDIMDYKYETQGSKGFTGGLHGKPGKWKSILTPEQIDLFWEIAGDIASQLEYKKFG
jgi:hypothetical protein